MLVISDLERLRQGHCLKFEVSFGYSEYGWSQPGLQSEFQASLGRTPSQKELTHPSSKHPQQPHKQSANEM